MHDVRANVLEVVSRCVPARGHMSLAQRPVCLIMTLQDLQQAPGCPVRAIHGNALASTPNPTSHSFHPTLHRWDDLQHMFSLPYSDQQLLALEALQLFAPLGHALGLGAVSSRVEDLCFKVLFPASYSHTSDWLHDVADVAEDALFACQQQLLVALDEHPRFKQLAGGCVVSTHSHGSGLCSSRRGIRCRHCVQQHSCPGSSVLPVLGSGCSQQAAINHFLSSSVSVSCLNAHPAGACPHQEPLQHHEEAAAP